MSRKTLRNINHIADPERNKRALQNRGARLQRAMNLSAGMAGIPFVNRKTEHTYHSATPRHRRFAEAHPVIHLNS